jgi:DNA-binding XRE family transcriptional regulator
MTQATMEQFLQALLQQYRESQPLPAPPPPPAELSLGVQIKKLRQEQGLSQKELATLAGVSIGPVISLEKNIKTTSLENTEKILRVLGKSLVIK